jgi:phage shock protein PspC (stress-responsive transcriptional regulator)
MDEGGGTQPGTPAGASVEEPAAQPSARRPLRRRAGHRLVAGVAGGLADYTGTRSLVYRLAFVVFTFLGGIGILAYLLLWWLIPREDLPDSAAERGLRRFPDAPSWVGIALLGLGVVLLAGKLGLWDTNVLWALLLIGLGVVLFRRDAQRPTADAHAPLPATDDAPTAVTVPQSTWAPRPPSSSRSVATPRAPREKSPLGWLVLGVTLLVVGAVAILQNLDAVNLPLVRFPALGLLVLGVGLLVGAFVGRARWLILPGLLLVPIVLAASLIDVPLQGGIDNIQAFPQKSGNVLGSYTVVAGSIQLDLTSLQGTAAAPVISASTGVGEIDVLVPYDAHVIATGRVGAGMVRIGPFSTDRGLEQSLRRTWQPRYVDGPTFTLDLQTGIGDIVVSRLAPTRKQLRELNA